MDTSFLSAFLPESFLEYFDLVNCYQLGNVKTKKMEFELHLDEQNMLSPDCNSSEYESKGFLPATRVQDFPIRGKAVYLLIRRRRWRHKNTKKEISNDYSFIAEGARLNPIAQASACAANTDRQRKICGKVQSPSGCLN